MENNNTIMNEEVKVLEEVAQIPSIDMKKALFVGVGVVAGGALIFVGKKFVAPKVKELHENRKAKKVQKQMDQSAEVEFTVVED